MSIVAVSSTKPYDREYLAQVTTTNLRRLENQVDYLPGTTLGDVDATSDVPPHLEVITDES